MIFTRLFSLVLFISLIGGYHHQISAQTPVPPPREDHQFWNEAQIIKPITKRQDFVLIGVLRIGRNWTRPVDERIGAGWAFKLNKHLTVMPTYIHVAYQPFAGRRINEDRWVLNVTGKFSAGKFLFTDRNLIERRVRYNNPDFTVYRNRLQIDYPVQLGEFKFKPFVADEIWYSTQSANAQNFGWYRNRLSVGIIKQFNARFTGEFFALYQSDGRSRPGNMPVLGTLFKYTL